MLIILNVQLKSEIIRFSSKISINYHDGDHIKQKIKIPIGSPNR